MLWKIRRRGEDRDEIIYELSGEKCKNWFSIISFGSQLRVGNRNSLLQEQRLTVSYQQSPVSGQSF